MEGTEKAKRCFAFLLRGRWNDEAMQGKGYDSTALQTMLNRVPNCSWQQGGGMLDVQG